MKTWEPNSEFNEWLALNIAGLDRHELDILFMPTVNENTAIDLLEDFMRKHPEYTHVEMGWDAESDNGWIVLIFPVEEGAFMPSGSGMGYGLAIAICQALYRASMEPLGLI